MSADQTFRVHASDLARNAEDTDAVLLAHGQMIITLSIAQHASFPWLSPAKPIRPS